MPALALPDHLYRPLAPRAGSRGQVADSFGLSGELSGLVPFDIHDLMLGRDDRRTRAGAEAHPFDVAGERFWWIHPSGDGDLNREVGLEGHRVTSPDEPIRRRVHEALTALSGVPWAFAMVRTYITSFALIELDEHAAGQRPITSCSLPDIPLCMFFSRVALKHIPPLSVSLEESVLLLAENIYHESVHQHVNHQIITEGVFTGDYDSRTSPLVDISWRKKSDGSPQQWQLDRVFHAAMVYGHLIAWRLRILRHGGTDDLTRRTIHQASVDSLTVVSELSAALQAHASAFSSTGAMRVGELIGLTQVFQEALQVTLQGGRAIAPMEGGVGSGR
ncbi:hypothetical protein [Planobispora takensis]|uniref:Uncharacterized protein n=1 Tax=Planobispora takensis TaxID=1367882 RepID=A0A8J3WSQ7_9ACTN|nr:hypothetical protein [Planobispora takensis]GIH98191.1 hypothetical protein Pta02_02000 [Planobispora takensis]